MPSPHYLSGPLKPLQHNLLVVHYLDHPGVGW